MNTVGAAHGHFVAPSWQRKAFRQIVSPSKHPPETAMHASIPAWVPALLLGLVILGYRQSLPRTVKPAKLIGVAMAMFALSLYGVVSAFGMEPLGLLAWAAGYAASLTLGAQYFASRGLSAKGTLVRVPGSWVPMALLIAIFGAKFMLGFAASTHAPVLHHLGFITAMSAVLGGLSGGFGARALAVQRYAAAATAA